VLRGQTHNRGVKCKDKGTGGNNQTTKHKQKKVVKFSEGPEEARKKRPGPKVEGQGDNENKIQGEFDHHNIVQRAQGESTGLGEKSGIPQLARNPNCECFPQGKIKSRGKKKKQR